MKLKICNLLTTYEEILQYVYFDFRTILHNKLDASTK